MQIKLLHNIFKMSWICFMLSRFLWKVNHQFHLRTVCSTSIYFWITCNKTKYFIQWFWIYKPLSFLFIAIRKMTDVMLCENLAFFKNLIRTHSTIINLLVSLIGPHKPESWSTSTSLLKSSILSSHSLLIPSSLILSFFFLYSHTLHDLHCLCPRLIHSQNIAIVMNFFIFMFFYNIVDIFINRFTCFSTWMKWLLCSCIE